MPLLIIDPQAIFDEAFHLSHKLLTSYITKKGFSVQYRAGKLDDDEDVVFDVACLLLMMTEFNSTLLMICHEMNQAQWANIRKKC